MNGEVNGAMEELSNTSLPDTTANKKEDLKEEYGSPKDEDSGDIVKSNRNDSFDPEPRQDSQRNNGLKSDSPENVGSVLTSNCNNETSTVPIQESSNNDVNNHCTNSNESFLESENSSQGISESITEQGTLQEIGKSEIEAVTVSSDQTVTIEDVHEVDSEDSSDEDGSVLSGEPRAADTVSINTESISDDDESSQEDPTKDKSNDIIIVENDNRPGSQNGISQETGSPEIHEIPSDNDDCVLTNDDKSNSSTIEKQPLRRSSRTIKRKTYDIEENGDDESDVEEVGMEDPLSGKTKPIIINDTKTLVEMAAKKMKMSQSKQKKEPTIVIIDTTSGKGQSSQAKSITTNSSINAQSLYQSIVARGTTVTPVSSKTNSSTQSSPQSSQALILPSLTDDMFVVEAPSFIVPYVYEKPSIKPFRESVDKLGKELEEQKAKEEKERLEKELEEKETRDRLRKERKERGEQVSESDDETKKMELEQIKKKKKAEKEEKHRRKNEDDESSWDGEESSDSDEEIIMSDEDMLVMKDKYDPNEAVPQLTADKTCNGKSDSYFDCSLGKFFVNIGLSLVQEYVQSDLLKQQNRKLSREKKSGHNTKVTLSAIASLRKNLEFSKDNNAPYNFPQIKCEFCSFKTESKLVLDHHLETPHMKNNLYKCNFCEYEIRSPHDILAHMELVHRVKGKLERAPSYHQCCNCPFEDNGKGKLARHQITCAKKYKPEQNLAPPIEWEPPAKIPKIVRARNNVMGSFQNAFNRQVSNSMMRTPIPVGGVMAGASGGGYRPRGRSPMTTAARAPALRGAPIIRTNTTTRHNVPTLLSSVYPAANNGKSKSNSNLSISITPLPRQPQTAIPQPTSQSKNTFVICEICDGYIKDLEQLRNHMQWIHKVRIHPKMIYNRPPLNCQKCQFRFFTDQGLERHLLGSHGLVTSSMQEAANKGKDAGRCPVCGRVYQWKLLNHVAKDHNLTLKPAHLSYKCTVCTATFGMYKQFENHVYSAHSVVAKRVMDKGKATAPPAKAASDPHLKPLKINDEITIIPQPVKPTTSTKTK